MIETFTPVPAPRRFPRRLRSRRARTWRLLAPVAVLAMLASVQLWSTSAPPSSATFGSSSAPSGEIVVKLRPGVDVARIADRYDSRVVDTLMASRNIHLLELESSRFLSYRTRSTIYKMGWDRDVTYAEPNFDAESPEGDRFHYWPSNQPTTVGYDPMDVIAQPAMDQIGLAEFRAVGSGAGITIAVLDTGVDAAHPALVGQVLSGVDYVDDDLDPADVGNGADDDGDGAVDEAVGHGTHVAGIASAVAPEAAILPMRVLDSDGTGSLFVTAEAIVDAVDRGADIVNVSFGVDGDLESEVFHDALRYAERHDVIVIAAAGNNASTARHYPAASPDVLGIAALDATGSQLAAFSNRGSWVAIGAPGTSIVSTIPGGRYAAWSGTSMASPFAAGGLAVLMGADDGLRRDADDARRTVRRATRAVSGVADGALDLTGTTVDGTAATVDSTTGSVTSTSGSLLHLLTTWLAG